MATDSNRDVLAGLLGVAVPLYIAELVALPLGRRDIVIGTWREQAEEAGVFGEAMLYRCGKPGDSARAFVGLAKALAALAFTPNGIRFLGMQFEAPTPANWIAAETME